MTIQANIQDVFLSKLRSELVQRCNSNSRYSLRAFARSLDIEASALSKIMAGKRVLTVAMINRLGSKLDWANDWGTREEGRDFASLELDRYELVKNWYHYAILELSRTKYYRFQHDWIARRLGISAWEVRDAVDRLVRLQMLDEKTGRPIENLGATSTVGTKIPANILKDLQRQMLDKAKQALDSVKIEERDHSTMVFAVKKSKLADAKKELAEFRKAFCSKMEASSSADEVYHLSMAFYPVSVKSN